MKSIRFILTVLLSVFVALVSMSFFQQGNPYFWTLKVRNSIVMQSTAPVYLGDTGTYIYQSTDGKIGIVSDGTGADDITLSGTTTFSDKLTGVAGIRGTSAFTTTAEVDTVLISGLTATSYVVVGGKYVGGVDQQDVLQAECKTDTLIVHRLASGESAGAYNYLIVH